MEKIASPKLRESHFYFAINMAIRENSIEVLVDFKGAEWKYKTYNFKVKEKYSFEKVEDITEFCEKTGFLNLFSQGKIKNVVDYCMGVE